MNNSDIEWTEFTSNPVKGECPVDCPYCYVKPLRKRYGWHEDIRFYPRELESIRRRKKPARIFVGSTIELFHDKTIQYMPEILETVRCCPQHTFLFLTKCPENLISFSPFPDNAWVGVTATDTDMAEKALYYLNQVEAVIKYISFEPLLEEIVIDLSGIHQGIIGQQTKPDNPPIPTWVDGLIDCLDRAGAKVFLKDNLKWCNPRQEIPGV